MSTAHAVIVGAGHAGGSAAALLRQYGWQGPITLIGAEPVPPYQRPPLSKSWLKGESNSADLLLRPAAFYQTSNVDLRLGCQVSAIDRAHKAVLLLDGNRISYDQLILATGSYARALPVSGHEHPGIVTLRSLADADRLRPLLRPNTRMAIIGAGYIGLEVAASARTIGCGVTVIEREARVLARVASVPLSDFFQRRHTEAGVHMRLSTSVETFEDATTLRLADGSIVRADVVLVGIGAAPADKLAREAGLDCANGVVVDGAARTSDPAIHAIGDCTFRPLPLYGRSARLESVPNALEQAKQAAADLCGRSPPAQEVPWFWSDQYEVRLQIAGIPFDVAETVLRGDPDSGSFAIFHLTAEGTVQAVEAANAPADFMAGRTMIARRRQVLAARLADMACSLRELAA